MDLLHTGDAEQIQQENGNTNKPFNNTQCPGRHHGFEEVSQPHRQQEKQQHTQNQGKANTAINDDVIHAVTQLLLQKFLKLGRLRFLCPIFPSDFRRAHQNAGTCHQGIHKSRHTAENRQTEQPFSAQTAPFFFLYGNPAFGIAYSHGIHLLASHHHAFDDSLTADIRSFHGFSSFLSKRHAKNPFLSQQGKPRIFALLRKKGRTNLPSPFTCFLIIFCRIFC